MEERHGQREVGRTRCLVRGEGQGHQGGVVPAQARGGRQEGCLDGQEDDQEGDQEDDRYAKKTTGTTKKATGTAAKKATKSTKT